MQRRFVRKFIDWLNITWLSSMHRFDATQPSPQMEKEKTQKTESQKSGFLSILMLLDFVCVCI